MSIFARNLIKKRVWDTPLLFSLLPSHLLFLLSIYLLSIMLSVFLSHSVCQMFSQSSNQSGTNCVRINGFWACKRCPLRRLLTPSWSLIKHLLKPLFATPWQQKTYKGRRITHFRFISSCSLICFVKINCSSRRVNKWTSEQVACKEDMVT